MKNILNIKSKKPPFWWEITYGVIGSVMLAIGFITYNVNDLRHV